MTQPTTNEYYRWSKPLDNVWEDRTPLSFPTQATSTAEEARQRFVRVSFPDQPDERLRCSLILRRGWYSLASEGAPAAPDGLQTVLRLMFRDGAEQLHLSVQSVELSRELAPADWLDRLLANQSIDVVHRRAWLEPSGLQEEVLGLIKTLGQPWVARMLALKDGDRLYYLRIWCSRNLYERFAEDMFLALSSFELEAPLGEPCAEPLEVEVMSVGEFETAWAARVWFPNAWKRQPVDGAGIMFRDLEHQQVHLHDSEYDADIHFGLLQRPPGLGRLELITGLRESLVVPGGRLEPGPMLEGPYDEGPPQVIGHYHAYSIVPLEPDLPPLSSPQAELAGQPQPEVPAAPDPWKLHLVTLGTQYAWFWIAWRPASPPAEPVGQCIGRRAFELILSQLELCHPMLM